jgi:hypothetical protein
VRASVAHAAIGSALISVLPRLAVHAEGVVGRLVLMASGTYRLGNAGGVWILLVGFVTGIARQPRMCALLQFLPLVVSGGARSACRVRGCQQIDASRAEEKADPCRTEAPAN